jgi:hypothetical protein
MNIINIKSPVQNTIIFYIIIFILVIVTNPKKIIKKKGVTIRIGRKKRKIPILVINVFFIILLYVFFLIVANCTNIKNDNTISEKIK